MLLMHATIATAAAAAATPPATNATAYSSANFVDIIVEYCSLNSFILQK